MPSVFAEGAPGQVFWHPKAYKQFSVSSSTDIAAAHPFTSANARHKIRLELRARLERERALAGEAQGEGLTDAEFARFVQENQRKALEDHRGERSERIRKARARAMGTSVGEMRPRSGAAGQRSGHKCPRCAALVLPRQTCCLACGSPVEPGDTMRGNSAPAAVRLQPLVGPQPLPSDLYSSGAVSEKLISAQEKQRLIKAEIFLGGGIPKKKRRPKRPQDAFRLEEGDIAADYLKHLRRPPNRFEIPVAGQQASSPQAKAQGRRRHSLVAPPKAPAAGSLAGEETSVAKPATARGARGNNVAEHGAAMALATQQHTEEERRVQEERVKQSRTMQWLHRLGRRTAPPSEEIVPFASGGARSREYALVRKASSLPASIRARREAGGGGALKAQPRSRRVIQWLGKRWADKALGRTDSLFAGIHTTSLEPEDLFRAIEARHFPDVAHCLASGCTVLTRNFEHRTPLHVASALGDKKMCTMLLSQPLGRAALGDVVNAVDGVPGRQWAPLHDAVDAGRVECVKLLLEHGANADARCAVGKTALMLAAVGRGDSTLTIMELLLGDAGNARIGLRDADGMRALHHAAARGSRPAVHLLLEVGAPPRAKDKAGRTASDLAKLHGRPRLADMLRSINISVNPKKIVDFTYESMALSEDAAAPAETEQGIVDV